MCMRKDDGYKPMMARVTAIVKESPLIKTFRLSFLKKDDGKSFSFSPGQFSMFSLMGTGEAPLSISSSPLEDKYLEVSVRNVGNVTNAMFRMKKGDTIGVRGSYGRGYPLENLKGKDILIVAGGIGFPPLASAIEYMLDNRDDYGKIWILYGVKEFDDLMYKKRMKRWSLAKDLDIIVTIETPCTEWDGCVGNVTELFTKLKINGRNTAGLSCGPPVMLKLVTSGFRKLGISDDDIYLSFERMMQCGTGKCGHCNIGDKYVCSDGPVFSYSDVKKMQEMVW